MIKKNTDKFESLDEKDKVDFDMEAFEKEQ